MKRILVMLIGFFAALAFLGCPAIEVRCRCPEPPPQKSKPYTGPPEIHEVGGEGRR